MDLFHKPDDFNAFVGIVAEGLSRYPVDLLAWCLMGNHWHLVLRPRADQALSRLMGWIGVTHVRRHHAHYRNAAGGHLYQGRFKSFPVQEDRHFLTLCRYVEANPLRAGLVKSAQLWAWSSLSAKQAGAATPALARWPVDRPRGWLKMVDEPMRETDAEAVRLSIQRDRPLGTPQWTRAAARRLGLEHTLRPRGRPRRRGKK
jgi:putative transposase